MLSLFRKKSSPESTPAHLDIIHDGITYRILLKRVPTARRFTLRIRNASRDVVLTMPKRSSLETAQDFAQKHAAWIGARLHRLPEAIPFRHGNVFPLRGEAVTVEHIDHLRGNMEFSADEKILRVSCSADHLSRRIHDFLKQEARKDLEYAVKAHCNSLGFAARKVTIRDTTSRWGSCSASGALNFSWRLIMAPPFVLDYLAAHEVAHLVHMNHSDLFWSVTKRLAPRTEQAEAWLYANGSSLHRYGAEV